ncbi:MAG: hypothetical protein MSB10_09580 [Clostridiales bacterium]|uniref:hypothetical protein n=1 Tax=Flavonifractor porci TaxID=3133422 RepID=UPI0030AA5403|nr:hypothetical protein [Clostridiales bacterium]
MYRIVKWTMVALSVLYLPYVFLIPFLAALRTSLLAWLLYVIFVMVTVFVCAINSKACRTVGQGMDLDEKNKEIMITQELERSKYYWTQM